MQLKKLSPVHFAAVLTVFGQLLQVKTQKEVASRLGINSASISDAKRRGAVPAGWLNTVSAETHISEAQIWERVHDVLAAAAETIQAKPGEVGRTTVSATQNGGVNHGTVAGIVNAMPHPAPHPPISSHSQEVEKRRIFDQTLTGWFAGVCDWWAAEQGTDSRSPVAFFREFDRRFPEYVAWSKTGKE